MIAIIPFLNKIRLLKLHVNFHLDIGLPVCLIKTPLLFLTPFILRSHTPALQETKSKTRTST